MTNLRIGHGYDVHRLTEGRALILGGVTIPYEKGLLGHSDADVLTHAVMDALLGAAALGDIGKLFPDSADEFAGISSMELLRRGKRRPHWMTTRLKLSYWSITLAALWLKKKTNPLLNFV